MKRSWKKKTVAETTKLQKIQNLGYIAKLNNDKSEIINVYIDRKTAAQENNYSSLSALDNPVKNCTITNGHYYMLYDSCEDELKDNFEIKNNNSEPTLYKDGVGQYDNKNNSHNKIIYTIFKKLLKERCFIDIGFVNKSNTTRLSDKFSFEPTKYQYLTYNIHSKTMDDFKDETTNIVKDIKNELGHYEINYTDYKNEIINVTKNEIIYFIRIRPQL